MFSSSIEKTRKVREDQLTQVQANPQQTITQQQNTQIANQVQQEAVQQQNKDIQQTNEQTVNTQQQVVAEEAANQQETNTNQITQQNAVQQTAEPQQTVQPAQTEQETLTDNADNTQTVSSEDVMPQSQINQIVQEVSQIQSDIPKQQIQQIVQQVAQKEADILSQYAQQQSGEQPSLTQQDKDNISQQIAVNVDLDPQKVQEVVSQILDLQQQQNQQETTQDDTQVGQPQATQQVVQPQAQQVVQQQVAQQITQPQTQQVVQQIAQPQAQQVVQQQVAQPQGQQQVVQQQIAQPQVAQQGQQIVQQQIAQPQVAQQGQQIVQQQIAQPQVVQQGQQPVVQQQIAQPQVVQQGQQPVVQQQIQQQNQQVIQPGTFQQPQLEKQQIQQEIQQPVQQNVEEVSQQIATQTGIPSQQVQQIIQQIKQKQEQAIQQQKQNPQQLSQQKYQQISQKIAQQKDIPLQSAEEIVNDIVQKQEEIGEAPEQSPQVSQQVVSEIAQEISQENGIPVDTVEQIVQQVIQQETQKKEQQEEEKEESKSVWEKMREEMYPPFGIKCNRFHRCFPFYKCENNKCVLQKELLNKHIKKMDVKREEKHERVRLAKRRERWAFIFNNEKEEESEVPDELKSKEEMAVALKKRAQQAKLRQQQQKKKQAQQAQQAQKSEEEIKNEVIQKMSKDLNLPPFFLGNTVNNIFDLLFHTNMPKDQIIKKVIKENHLPEKNAKTLIDLLYENKNKVYEQKKKEFDFKFPTFVISPLVFTKEYGFVDKWKVEDVYDILKSGIVPQDFAKKMSEKHNIPESQAQTLIDILNEEINKPEEYGFVDKEKVEDVYEQLKNGNVPQDFAKKMSEKHNIPESQAQTLIDILNEEINKVPVKEYGFVDKNKVEDVYEQLKNGNVPQDFAKKMSEKHDIPESQAQTLIDILNEDLNKVPVKEYGFVDKKIVEDIYNELLKEDIPQDLAKKMSEKHDIPETQAQTLIDILNEDINKEPVKEYGFVDKEKVKQIYEDVKKGENTQDLSKKESQKLDITEKDAQTVIDALTEQQQVEQQAPQQAPQQQAPQQVQQQQQAPQQQVQQQEDEYKTVRGLFTVINGLGNCGFSNLEDFDDLYTGVTMDIYNNGDACGGCMKVKGPDGEVKVRVADSNGGGEKTLTLSKKAFGMIYHGEGGEIPEIQYKWVDCGSEDNIKFEVINGANEYYMGIRPLNSNKRVVKMEIFDDNFNEWREMDKRGDFAFIAQPKDGKLISLPYKLRLTSQEGKVIEDTLNEFQSGKVYDGTTQF